MLAESAARITAQVPDDAKVLDVGGWGSPLPRADWVLDLLPYETRGLYAYSDADRARERFTADTWIRHDICAREPWPIEDDAFDFVVCSHTLEDIRDPVWVCQELSRVARAGYVEVPSRLEEQIQGFNGDWVGWAHHRWLIDERDGALEFLFKSHEIHGDPAYAFPLRLRERLSPAQRVLTHWWEGEVRAHERVLVDPAELHEELAGYVRRHAHLVPPAPPLTPRQRLRHGLKAVGRRVLG